MNTPNKQSIQEKISELQSQLKGIEEAEKQQDTIIVKELKIEVQKNLLFKSIKYKDLVIPKGWRLLTFNEAVYIYDNQLLDNFPYSNWEMIQQFSKRNLEKGYWVSCLGGDYDGDRLVVGGVNCGGYNGGYALGVRFCRDIKVKK